MIRKPESTLFQPFDSRNLSTPFPVLFSGSFISILPPPQRRKPESTSFHPFRLKRASSDLISCRSISSSASSSTHTRDLLERTAWIALFRRSNWSGLQFSFSASRTTLATKWMSFFRSLPVRMIVLSTLHESASIM